MRIFTGICSPEYLFKMRDPSVPTEFEFESWVVKGLICMFPNYHCVVFGGTFIHEGRSYRPDLALVARDFSHWFIIEVELTSHSFEEHVLPQVSAFRHGYPAIGCDASLAKALGVKPSQGQTLLEFVPYAVAVVINRDNQDWKTALRAHSIQVLVVSSYVSPTGLEAIGVDGVLEVVSESLGFGEYVASVRAIRFGSRTRLPEGRLQIRDLYGNSSWWSVVKDIRYTWVSKEVGTSDLADRRMVQLIATSDGYLSMR